MIFMIMVKKHFLPYSSQIYDQTSNPATPWFDMQGQDDLKKPKADDEICITAQVAVVSGC